MKVGPFVVLLQRRNEARIRALVKGVQLVCSHRLAFDSFDLVAIAQS